MAAPDRAVEETLASIPMFADVPPGDLSTLISSGSLQRFRMGAFVFLRGEPADRVYCVLEGRIQISSSSQDGRTQLLAVLGPGETFGELGVLGEQPRSGSAECLGDAALWGIDGGRFLAFVEEQPSVATALLRSLSRQVLAQDALVEDLLFLDLKGRVAKRLLALVTESWDELPEDGTPLPWDITQSDLASLSGGSRENVNRILSEFQRRGLIERSGRRYVLHDIKGLRRLAGV